MLWNRAQMILLLAASVAVAACDAGPVSKSASKRPVRQSKPWYNQAEDGLTEQDKRNLARMGVYFGDDERARTDPRRFQRGRQAYRPQPNYDSVPDSGDYYVPDAQ